MPPSRYRYSCRPKLESIIESRYYPDTVLLWFCLSPDPVDNVDSSNPKRLYTRWQRLAAQDDQGDQYVRSLRNDLYEAVRKSRLPEDTREDLRQRIRTAAREDFQPERLRLDLSWIARHHRCSLPELLRVCRRRAEGVIACLHPQIPQPDDT